MTLTSFSLKGEGLQDQQSNPKAKHEVEVNAIFRTHILFQKSTQELTHKLDTTCANYPHSSLDGKPMCPFRIFSNSWRVHRFQCHPNSINRAAFTNYLGLGRAQCSFLHSLIVSPMWRGQSGSFRINNPADQDCGYCSNTNWTCPFRNEKKTILFGGLLP